MCVRVYVCVVSIVWWFDILKYRPAGQAGRHKRFTHALLPPIHTHTPKSPKAIVENLDVKIPFYKQLGSIVKPSAIFGSNTSSLKIADFARPSGRPQQFVSAW